MSVVQGSTQYAENLVEGIEGQIINTVTCDVDTYFHDDDATTNLGFGLGVKLKAAGTNDHEINVGAAANNYVGITVKDPTRSPQDSDGYPAGAHVNVLWRGDIMVKTVDAVNPGNDVYIVDASGAIQTGSTSSTQIAGARFMRSAAAGGLTVVRLSGALPSS